MTIHALRRGKPTLGRLPPVSLDDDRRRVLAAAGAIEPDRERCLAWYREDPLLEFGHRTAAEVVRAGETSRLIAMINGIRVIEGKR